VTFLRTNRCFNWRQILQTILVGLAYYDTATLGQKFAVVADVITLSWLPSGVARAAMIWSACNLWPAVLVAAFMASALAGVPSWVAFGIAAGNALEASTGALLLKRLIGFRILFGNVRDVFALIGTAVTSSVISASVGATILESYSFVAALQQLADKSSQRYEIQCVFDCNSSIHLPDKIAQSIFIGSPKRRSRTRLSTVSHGGISIDSAAAGGTYRLLWSQDGIGFNPSTMTYAAGLGHHVMRYRARITGASFSIRSRPEGAKQVSVVGR